MDARSILSDEEAEVLFEEAFLKGENKQFEESFQLYNQLIQKLEPMGAEKSKMQRIYLARAYNNITLKMDNKNSLPYLSKSQELINEFHEDEFNPALFHLDAVCKTNLCEILWNDKRTRKQCHPYLLSSLDSWCKDKEITTQFKSILRTYEKLVALSINPSLDFSFYFFAAKIFDEATIPNFAIEFENLHTAILNHFTPYTNQSNILLHSLFQMMQLIKNNINNAHFPNSSIKLWFQDKENQEIFETYFEEVRIAYKPRTLLHNTEHSHSFLVALTQKLCILEDKIKFQDQRIKELEAQLQIKIYQNNATLFKPPTETKRHRV